MPARQKFLLKSRQQFGENLGGPCLKRFLVFLFALAIFLFLPQNVLAEVVINEFNSSSSDDWIELYNTSNSEVDLKDWLIEDTASTPVYQYTTSIIIPSRGFCVVTAGSRLNNNGDKIRLLQGDAEKDCVAYGNGNGKFCNSVADIGAPVGEVVVARKPDGNGSWAFSSPTYGYSNSATSEPGSKVLCYIPSPPVTATPTPTLSPTSSPATGTYKINEVKDEGGSTLSNVKVYVDDQYAHHYAPETSTFGDGRYCDDDKQIQCGFGEHAIRLEKDGFGDWEETVTIDSGFYKEVDPVMSSLDLNSSPTPTPTPIPTPTKKPTPTPTPSLGPTPTGEILGEEATPSAEEPSPTPEVLGETSRELNISGLLPKILIGAGLILLAVSGGFLLFPKLKGYNKNKDEETPSLG